MRTIETAISEMLGENTGVSIFDSGGVNGRLWQQNQGIDDFKNINVIDVEIYDKDDILISYNVYHYLTNFLDVTETSEMLNNGITTDKNNFSDIELMERILMRPSINTTGYGCHEIVNTYNYDNIISTTLQYAIFEYGGEYSTNTYIILQIHTGADVRGGYTTPQIFMIEDPDYFIMAQCDVYAFCGCGGWHSDDCGYNWYPDDNESEFKDITYIDNDEVLRCSDCYTKIEFGVMEDY